MSRRPSDLRIDPTLPKGRLVTLRALWPFVRRQRGLFIAWLLALAASSAATLSLPVAVRRMIDQGFTSAERLSSCRTCSVRTARWSAQYTAAPHTATISAIATANGRMRRGRNGRGVMAEWRVESGGWRVEGGVEPATLACRDRMVDTNG